MTAAIKTNYDTLTTDLRRGPDGGRTPAHYLEKWKRKRGLVQRPGGGKLEKFRRIFQFHGLSISDIVEDRLPRVALSEYHWYRWHVGKLLCVYCNVELDGGSCTQDHVIPRCRGGARLGRDNLEPACVECNSAKGDMSLLEFLVSRTM
jgi:5-methylcytosine-specific restriction endonuclease McrA